jgi:hypothetical protein
VCVCLCVCARAWCVVGSRAEGGGRGLDTTLLEEVRRTAASKAAERVVATELPAARPATLSTLAAAVLDIALGPEDARARAADHRERFSQYRTAFEVSLDPMSKQVRRRLRPRACV